VELAPRHRRLASGLLGLGIFVGLGLTLWFGVPALTGQLRGLSAEIPEFQRQIQAWGEWLSERTGLNVRFFGDRTQSFFQNAFGDAQILGRAMSVVEGVFLPLVIIIGGVYAVARPNERLLNPLLNAVPRDRRDSFRELFALLGDRLRGWVKGTLFSILLVGLLTGLGLWLVGVQFALLLGVIAGMLELVPIIGPWVAGGLAVAVALLDDPSKAMWAAGVMLLIQQLESNIITPLVMAKAAEVHPFVTLFGLFLFGSIFGFLGILLAVPLILLLWTLVEVLWVQRAIKAEHDVIEPVVHES
jgi:predicted PurR-regulated permease PerM